MPIFNYKCKSCEKQFECLVLKADEAPDPCPDCGGSDVEKTLTSHGGYHIHGNNSASERPRRAGSFKK